MVTGVTEGYEKKMEIVGTGYRVLAKGSNLEFALGYSHPITVEPPGRHHLRRREPHPLLGQGIDKQQVGEVAANIRKLRKPDPYKGKGVRYAGEQSAARSERLGSKPWLDHQARQEQVRRTGRRHLRGRKKIAAPPSVRASSCHALGPAHLRPGRRRHRGQDPGVGLDDGGDLRAFEGDKTAKAKKVGELVAERAKAAGIEAVVFDRGGNKYHGRSPPSPTALARAGLTL
jgi:hypothetical protein